MDSATPHSSLRIAPTLALLAFCLPLAFAVGSAGLAVAMQLDGSLGANAAATPSEWYEANFATPKGLLVLVLPMQLTFLALALVPAWLSPTPFRERLALARPRLCASTFALVLAGTLGIQFAIEIAAEHVLGEPSPALKRMAELIVGARGGFALALLLCVSIVPGLCEELFFRGYAQSRLVARHGFAAGMLLPTLVFALAHGDPQHIALVLGLGAWLAYLAWRARSTWVAIACHAWNNFAAVVITRSVGIRADGSLDSNWIVYAGCATGLVCAAFAIARLERGARGRFSPDGTARASDAA